ncbi:MAG: hypothetical protein CMH54_04725 [Myxococcales bacterium]|nr:hypothetical protein [Myxococcales bacterium]
MSLRNHLLAAMFCLFSATALGAGPIRPAEEPQPIIEPTSVPTVANAVDPATLQTKPQERLIQPKSQIEVEALMLEYEQALRVYERAGISMRDEIRKSIAYEANRRIRYINELYDKKTGKLESDESRMREDAIRLFARFVKRYPDHPEHSPHALFRLAELYYEQAKIDEMSALDVYEKQSDLYRRGKIADEPVVPEKDFSKVFESLKTLVTNFPSYRLADAAYYLLGFTLIEAGEEGKGRDTFLSLVEKYPDSTYAPESLLRLGELEFELSNFADAAHYYKRVLAYKDGRFFDISLYKLAWSYYQMFDYPRSIQTFKRLLAHYHSLEEQEGQLSGQKGELQAEAVEYVAKALAEDDWDGDGEKEPDAGVQRALSFLSEGQPYERKILAKYAEVLFDQHEADKYMESSQVYRELIRSNPFDPENPRYQKKVIQIFDLVRDFSAGAVARGEMANLFGKGSAWYRANQENAGALARASLLVETAMLQKAGTHHMRAQELKLIARSTGEPDKAMEALEQYRLAAESYQSFLDRYPASPQRYNVLYDLADALYYGGKYKEAAEAYASVRDYKDRTEYQSEAGYLAVSSLERAIEALSDAGELPPNSFASDLDAIEATRAQPEKTEELRRVTPQPIPPILLTWIGNADRFVELGLTRKDDPDVSAKFAYRAAAIFYRFNNFDEARKRLADIVENRSESPVAANAADMLINSFTIENDWPNIQKWAAIMEKKKIGRPEKQAALRKKIRVYQLGAQFKTAEQLLEQEKYIEAAEEFERLAAQPDVKFADKALYNAAMAYIKEKHYDRASKAFETILKEPRFDKSEFRELALFEVAENSKKFFDFNKAISSYLALVRKNAKNENSPYALFEAAKLYYDDGQYENAANAFERYEKSYTNREDAIFALYRAAESWAKRKNTRQERRLLMRFVERGREKPKLGQAVLKALVRLGEIELKKGRPKFAKRFFENVIALYNQRGFQPESPEAYHAARAQFELVDFKYREYKGIVLKGNVNQMVRQIQNAQAMLKKLQNDYAQVALLYRSVDWNFAAFFRLGEINQIFAQKLYDAPEPRGMNPDDLDIYRTQLEEEGARWEDNAVKKFEEMVGQARSRKVTNKWVRDALEFLNNYKPQEYPLAKQERELYVWDDIWSFQAIEGQPEPDKKEQPSKEPIKEKAPEKEAPSSPEAPVPVNTEAEPTAPATTVEETTPAEPAKPEPNEAPSNTEPKSDNLDDVLDDDDDDFDDDDFDDDDLDDFDDDSDDAEGDDDDFDDDDADLDDEVLSP